MYEKDAADDLLLIIASIVYRDDSTEVTSSI